MLASLLPGLREVRAPLAAGYLWFAVAWVLFEPVVPERDQAEGVVASLYRASDLPSFVGIGVVVLSFAAYLLGELSSNTLAPVLRRFFPQAWPGQGSDWPRSPLSQQARDALLHVVRRSHDQLTSSLALSGNGLNLDRFLEEQTGRRLPAIGLPSPPTIPRPPSKRMPPPEPPGPGYARPQDDDARQIALMARTVLEGLDVVAKTRLLGRDPELYAEVDRNRAAVEFDLAITPPLLAFTIAVGARSGPLVLALLVPLGALLSWGLFRDAVRSEKVGSQLLLQSIEDRRVYVPALERLETAAAAGASRQHPDFMREADEDAVVALQSAAQSLEQVGASEPSLAKHARRQIDLAEEPVTRVRRLFPSPVVQTSEEAIGLLTESADAWVAMTEGFGPPNEEPRELVEKAQELLARFQREARDAVQQATSLAAYGNPTGPRPTHDTATSPNPTAAPSRAVSAAGLPAG